ncbi:hypothetical protein [Hymenobacter cellulosivorans]|uniref:Minor tail protein n=1 Tax=Hymenobacter cellulosivorans TaxID=2932249 RepID=A0ABY4F8R1_9BACT|nr:hypothetical protein [Hymenobacter cellulosivorans]UOQ53063.1 hypothetical protein MUN80_25415 [Hymenobacter cellulosivorans]
MALETLDTLTFDNSTWESIYDTTARTVSARQIEPIGPELAPLGTPFRSYDVGFVLQQYRADQDRITLTSIGNKPWVEVTVDANYYQTVCDLAGQADVVGDTVTLTATSSHPPIQYMANGGNYSAQTVYPGQLPGNHVARFKDAAGCEITRNYTIANPEPVENPDGLLIDEFGPVNGETYKLYYKVTPAGRIIVVRHSPNRQGELATVTVAERGRENGELVGEGFCEGTTRVEFRSTTGSPFLVISTIANSPSCGFEVVPLLSIDSVDPFAPTGPAPANGSVDVWTSGGKPPIKAYVAGVTAADLTLTDGMGTIAAPPGLYTVQVADSSTPALRAFREFRIPPYVAPIIGCDDEEASNYNPLATQRDNSLCVYTSRWRSLWPSLPIDVVVQDEVATTYVTAELYAGLIPGHPHEADRPLVFVTTLRATISPRTAVARFDVAPYLRPLMGALGSDGVRRLDINSPTAFSDDLYTYYRLKVGAKTIESGYVLNAALADLSLHTTSPVPLTPFGKMLPFWPGYSFPLSVLNFTGLGRYAFVTEVDPGEYEELGVHGVFMPCPTHGLPVRWVSPEGGYGYWVFAGKHQYGDDISDGATYTEAGTGEQRYSSPGVARRTVQVSTGPFRGRELVEGLRTLRRSPQVWYQPGGVGSEWVPVVVNRGAFPAYREGQTRYEFSVSFTEAAPQYTQGQ